MCAGAQLRKCGKAWGNTMHSVWDKGEGEHDGTHYYVMKMRCLAMHSARETDMGIRHEREHMGSTWKGMQGESAQAHADAMEIERGIVGVSHSMAPLVRALG